jgi:succinate dehydrogenase / fumarate reductase flavoprotein subunit
MIDACGISRHREGLRAAIPQVQALAEAFREQVRIPGGADGLNAELEKALRLEDAFGLAELMLRDALAREESCGAHFREEHQTADGEARRNDAEFAHIAAWESRDSGEPIRHTEPLGFEAIAPSQRSYK